jgi:hypothetical protein
MAGITKNAIELDWQTCHYDQTLLKYRPRTLGKTATEISAPELFAKFTQYQAKEENLLPSTLVPFFTSLEAVVKLRVQTLNDDRASIYLTGLDEPPNTLEPPITPH